VTYQLVGTNLIGSVTIGSNAIGASDDSMNTFGSHKERGHRIGDEGARELILDNLKSS